MSEQNYYNLTTVTGNGTIRVVHDKDVTDHVDEDGNKYQAYCIQVFDCYGHQCHEVFIKADVIITGKLGY